MTRVCWTRRDLWGIWPLLPGGALPMAEVYDTSEFRNGLKILYDGDPFVIIEFQHVKPGKGSAFVRTRIKNLLTGRVLEPTLKSGDKVGKPDMEEKEMQYLYKEGDQDRKSTRLNSSHLVISYAVFCLNKNHLY